MPTLWSSEFNKASEKGRIGLKLYATIFLRN